jgi:hypothetical protein
VAPLAFPAIVRAAAVSLLVLALVLPAAAPAHALPSGNASTLAPTQALLLAWYTDANDSLHNVSILNPDYGFIGTTQSEALRDIAAGTISFGAAQAALLRAYPALYNVSTHQPPDNGSQASRRAIRLYYQNASALTHSQALVRLAAVEADYKNFSPTTGNALEMGILGGRLFMTARATIYNDYATHLSRLEASAKPTEPDTTTLAFRTEVVGLFDAGETGLYLLQYSEDVLRLARASDGSGAPLLADSYSQEIATYANLAKHPPAGPYVDLLPMAVNSTLFFNDHEPVIGLANYLVFDELVRGRTFEIAQQNGGAARLTYSDLVNQSKQDYSKDQTGIEIAQRAGLNGELLRDALSYADSGKDASSQASHLEAASAMEGTIVSATQVGGGETDLPLIGAIGLLAVAGVVVTFLALRRRG